MNDRRALPGFVRWAVFCLWAWCGCSFAQTSVRVSTAWTAHKLSVVSCLDAARAVLTSVNMQEVSASSMSATGEGPGHTVVFRCDYPNTAFIVSAWRERPPDRESDAFIERLRTSMAAEAAKR